MGNNITTVATTAQYNDVRNTYNTNFELVQKSFADGAEPTDKVVGQLWMDTTNDKMKFYNDSAWHSVVVEDDYDSIYTFASGIIVDGDFECGKNISCSGYIKTGSNILCGSNIYASGLLQLGSNILCASNIYASGDITAGDKMTAGSGFIASAGGYMGLPVHASTPVFTTKGYMFFDDTDDKVKVNDVDSVKIVAYEPEMTRVEMQSTDKQTIPSATGTIINWQTSTASIYDDASWFNASVNPSVIIPTVAGRYRITANLQIPAVSLAGSGTILFDVKSGATLLHRAVGELYADKYYIARNQNIAIIASLPANASIYTRIYQSTGSTLTLDATYNNLTVERVK